MYGANALNQLTSKTNPTVRVLGTAKVASQVTSPDADVYKSGRNFAATVVPSNLNGPTRGQVTVAADLSGNPELLRQATQNWFTPAANQSLAYDADGNLQADDVWSYTYDGEDRLLTMESTLPAGKGYPRLKLEFKYDYQNRRIEKKVTDLDSSMVTLQRRYIYNGSELIAELDTSGAILRSYTWGLDVTGTLTATGGVGALLEITWFTGTTAMNYLPVHDANGNSSALVRSTDGIVAATYEYGAFGEPMRAQLNDSAVADNPFQFSTYYTDFESGLVYYGRRYYSPSLGRFINRDPIEEAGGRNLYGFCGNNGVDHFDIGGMGVDDQWKDIRSQTPITLDGMTVTATRYGSDLFNLGSLYLGHNGPPSVTVSSYDTDTVGLPPPTPDNALNVRQFLKWKPEARNDLILDRTRARIMSVRSKLRVSLAYMKWLAQTQSGPSEVTSIYSERLGAWVAIAPDGMNTVSLADRHFAAVERALEINDNLYAWTYLGLNVVLTAMSFNPEVLIAQAAMIGRLAAGIRATILAAGEGIAEGMGYGAEFGNLAANSHYIVVEGADGLQYIQFDASLARLSTAPARSSEYGSSRETLAALNELGEVFVREGKHRVNLTLEGMTFAESVPGRPGWLEYQFDATIISERGVPAGTWSEPLNKKPPLFNPLNPYDGQEGY